MDKKKKRIYKPPYKSCDTCGRLTAIGEGDHICDADPAKVVMEGYAPADDNFWCGGTEWVRG